MVERGEHGVEKLAWIPGTRRNGHSDEAQDRLRLAPGAEVGELVRTDQEHGVVGSRPLLAQEVDRVGVVVANDLDPREIGEGEAGQLEAILDVGLDRLVAGGRDDENEEPLEPEVLEGPLREREVAVVRRVEGPAEEAGPPPYSPTASRGNPPAPGAC